MISEIRAMRSEQSLRPPDLKLISRNSGRAYFEDKGKFCAGKDGLSGIECGA
jgi:hypothetical protein